MKRVKEIHIIILVLVMSLGLIQASSGSVQEKVVETTPIIAPGALKKFIRANHPKELEVREIRAVQKRLADVVHVCMKQAGKADPTCKALWKAINL